MFLVSHMLQMFSFLIGCSCQRRLRCVPKWVSALYVPKTGRKHLFSPATRVGGETREAPEACSDVFIGLSDRRRSEKTDTGGQGDMLVTVLILGWQR